MHPQIKKDGPGKCPICGMDLVKASQQTETQKHTRNNTPAAHAAFQLDPARVQMIGLKTGTVEKKELFKSIDVAGRVAFDPELYTAQIEFMEAVKQLESVRSSPLADVRHSAERMVESAKLRLKILGLSDKQIVNLRTSKSSGSSLLIPKPGDNVWVYAEVYEMDLPYIDSGLEARITGSSIAGGALSGKVVSVDRVINPTTRTAKVRISVPNAKKELRPESYVDVSILSPLGMQTTVPFDAILDSGKESWVFVVESEGHFRPQLVTVRLRAGDEVAISQGLKGGETIVTSANFLIDSESRLRGVLAANTENEDGSGEPAQAKAPQCPKGQVWHADMKHCMPKVGE